MVRVVRMKPNPRVLLTYNSQQTPHYNAGNSPMLLSKSLSAKYPQ